MCRRHGTSLHRCMLVIFLKMNGQELVQCGDSRLGNLRRLAVEPPDGPFK